MCINPGEHQLWHTRPSQNTKYSPFFSVQSCLLIYFKVDYPSTFHIVSLNPSHIFTQHTTPHIRSTPDTDPPHVSCLQSFFIRMRGSSVSPLGNQEITSLHKSAIDKKWECNVRRPPTAECNQAQPAQSKHSILSLQVCCSLQ